MEEKSCFNCKNYQLCFLRHRIDKALECNGILNINNPDHEGSFIDVYSAIGKCCQKYE